VQSKSKSKYTGGGLQAVAAADADAAAELELAALVCRLEDARNASAITVAPNPSAAHAFQDKLIVPIPLFYSPRFRPLSRIPW
jgi:hypothetical protein